MWYRDVVLVVNPLRMYKRVTILSVVSACYLCVCCSPSAQDIGALDYGFEPQSLPDDYEVRDR